MARLRRFLMLERPRGGEGAAGEPAAVRTRFASLGAPPPPADPFAPPPEPAVLLDVADPPAPPRPAADEALAAEIRAMAERRADIAVAPAAPRHRRGIDRLAAGIAVGPLARLSPRARVALVTGVALAALAGLFAFAGIGPRVLQGALLLLLFALFLPS